MNEQTNTATQTTTNQENVQEGTQNVNAEQATSETSVNTSGNAQSEQVDFSQMYDMLTQRDNKIKELEAEISGLKKTNTQLLLKVNATPSADGQPKNPYEGFIDLMVKR